MALPTLLFVDGFENGLPSIAGPYSASAGSPAMVTSPVRTGARSLEISATAAAEQLTYNLPTGSQIVTQAIYVRFASLPTGAGVTDQLLVFGNAGGNGILRYGVDNNKFNITNGTSSGDVGPTLAVDTWYRVLVEYDTSGANAVIRAKIDGGTEASISTARAAADTTLVRVGTASAQTYTAYFDDWICSVTDGDYELCDAVSSHSVVRLKPTSDGTHNVNAANTFEYSATGTDITNSSTDVYTLLDDDTIDTTPTDYVNQVAGPQTDYVEVVLEDLPSGTDDVVDVRGYMAQRDSSSTGTTNATAKFYDSDTGTGTITLVKATALDPGAFVKVYAGNGAALVGVLTRPSGGWTRTKTNALRGQVGFADGTPQAWFTTLFAEVALFPAAGGTDATATPAVIEATSSVPAPTTQAAATISATTVAAIADLPAPTIIATSPDVTVAPSTVAALASMPAPTVSGSAKTLVYPLNLVLTPISSSEIDLQWDAVAGAATYDIERDGVVVQTGVTGTTYPDTGLTADTPYRYRVGARP